MGLTLLRAVPLWVWALAAALLWGGWQHRRAEQAGAERLRLHSEAAKLREEALRGALVETTRRLAAQQEVANAAQRQAKQAAADAASASAAAGRLRAYADKLAARAAACDPAAAGVGQAASAPAVVLADMLSRLEEAGRQLAAESDRRRAAGEECVGRYDALTK